MLIPIIRGVRVLCSIFLRNLNIHAGRVIFVGANIPTRLPPRRIITIEAIMPRKLVNIGLIPIACPSNQSIAPRIANPQILPTWKRIIFFLSLMLS